MTYTNWLIDNKNNTVIKTRDLDLYSYFTKLQEEYICAELRKKIYPKAKDKRFYERVMQGKQEKIKDISFRNALPNIFTSEKLKEKIYSTIYGTGFPNFIYCNEIEKSITEQLDKRYYYSSGTLVKIFIDGDILIGTLISVTKDYTRVTISIEKKDQTFDINLISRIL